MEKNKVPLVMVALALGLICIVLAVNLGITTSKLNAEKAASKKLNEQIANLNSQLLDLRTKYDDQINITTGLEIQLDSARKEAEDAKKKLESLQISESKVDTQVGSASVSVEE